jgi:hypothetical protein
MVKQVGVGCGPGSGCLLKIEYYAAGVEPVHGALECPFGSHVLL